MYKTRHSLMQNTIRPGLVVLGFAMLGLTGCSTMSAGVESFNNKMSALGDKIQSITGNVQVTQEDETTFHLTEQYAEPVTTFESWAMRSKAKDLCPTGFVFLTREAKKKGAFADSHDQCVGDKSCGYELEWRIKCSEVPQEPFTFFGKT